MNMEEKVLQIPIENIVPNRFQPRLTFDETALQELAESIKEHGIIQPLVLRKIGDKYEIIAGERRYKASQMAGLKAVPAIISDIDDKKSAEVALVENIQRKNLTSIEEARSYKNILDQGYLTQEQLAEKLGISQATVANKLRLLNLADEVQDALLQEKISERHARSLLAIKDKDDQVKWLNRILNERLTVRQLDVEIKKELRNVVDDDEDIPIVNLNPNIDEIKQNALDINPVQGLHDVEKMLQPTPVQENTSNLSNPVDTIETLDFDDDSSSNNEMEVLNIDEDNKIPNKFFNFLEDEGANMNETNSIDELYVDNNPQDNIEVPIYNEQIENDNMIDETLPSNDSNYIIDNENLVDSNNIIESPNIMDSNNIINDSNLVDSNNIIESPNLMESNSVVDDSNLLNTNDVTYDSNDSSEELLDDSVISPDILNNKEETIDLANTPIDNSTSATEEPTDSAPRTGKFFNFDFSNEDTTDDLNVQPTNVEEQNYTDDNVIIPTDNNIEIDNNIITSADNNNIDLNNNIEINDSSANNNFIYDTNDSNDNNSDNANNYIFDGPTPDFDYDNNVIELEQNDRDKEVFDPMNMVDTLEDDYEERIQEEEGTDLKTAINSIRNVRDVLENNGFNITMDEADLGNSYNIIINIEKEDN